MLKNIFKWQQVHMRVNKLFANIVMLHIARKVECHSFMDYETFLEGP